jgi:hypothetical protein
VATCAAIAASSAGCGPGGTHGTGAGPHGADGTFSFSWLINGVDPTDPSDPCTRADIRFIKMVIVDYNNVAMHDDSFAFDCRLGRYMSAQPELRAGTYRVYWEADGADGTMISSTFVPSASMPVPGETITVNHGTNVDFDAENRPDSTFDGAPTNFATGSGTLSVPVYWAMSGTDAMGTACAPATVATLSYTLRMSNNVVQDQQPAAGAMRPACAAALSFPNVNWDDYSLDVDGFDATGAQHWHGHCAGQLLTEPPGPSDADGGPQPPTPPRCVIARTP